MLHYILILMISLPALAAPTVDPVANALSLTESTQKLMSETASRPKRKTLFEGYRREIARREDAIQKITSDEDRKLQLTLSGIRIYTGLIDLDDLSQEGCDSSRGKIQLAHSPKEEKPAVVPEEARIAVKFLELLCANKQ